MTEGDKEVLETLRRKATMCDPPVEPELFTQAADLIESQAALLKEAEAQAKECSEQFRAELSLSNELRLLLKEAQDVVKHYAEAAKGLAAQYRLVLPLDPPDDAGIRRYTAEEYPKMGELRALNELESRARSLLDRIRGRAG